MMSKTKRKIETDVAGVVETILSSSGEGPHILFGPVVWQPSDGKTARRWYFIVASSDARHADGFSVASVQCGNTKKKCAIRRSAIKMAIVQKKIVAVLHDFDDELEMARWAEALWPGKRSTEIRSGLEAERNGGQI